MSSNQKSKAATNWHRFHVYHDPDFVADIKALPKRNLSHKSGEHNSFDDYERLAEKYGISADFVDFVHERNWSDFDPSKNIGGNVVSLNQRGDGFTATLNLHVTKEQILDLFTEIRRLRMEFHVSEAKYKAPADTELLYAIHKARSSSKSFKKIFTEYQEGSLPLYVEKPKNQYSSEDELEKYYRTHYSDKV